MLSDTANHALASSTWSTYKTALTQLSHCSQELNVTFDFPLPENKTLLFIGWLLKKGLSASTIESYLSGLRQGHLLEGHSICSLRTPLVNQVVQGRKNQQAVEKLIIAPQERLPVTPNMLLLIKKDLKSAPLPKVTKLLIWSAATLLFHGGFRGGELLAKKDQAFDPSSTLLGKDISLLNVRIKGEKIQLLQVCLKLEKTNKSEKVNIIDVYASNGHTCPVKAWKKFLSCSNLDPSLPAFREANGSNFTCTKMNNFLRGFNNKYLKLPGRSLSCHSFRAGLASLLGQIGYSDTDIQSSGRWSSRAFLTYIKLPRTRRLQMAREIASLNC